MAPAPMPAEQQAEAALFRAALRRRKLAERDALAAPARALAAARIEAHLDALLASRAAGTIAFCWPVRSEFDCRPAVTRLLAAGWRACQPVVVAAAAPMEFRAWVPGAAMTTDRHGIPIPACGAPAVPDVVLLPLVAFDEAGFRLGYGGGYFDRTLAVLAPRPLAVGVGFETARVDTLRPQAHDVRLDAIVTEAGIRELRAGA